jgi:hypothetical protein
MALDVKVCTDLKYYSIRASWDNAWFEAACTSSWTATTPR